MYSRSSPSHLRSTINVGLLDVSLSVIPEKSYIGVIYNLRSRKRNKTLIPKTVDLSDRDFLIRCLCV